MSISMAPDDDDECNRFFFFWSSGAVDHLSRGETPPGSSGDPSDQSEYLYEDSAVGGMPAEKAKAQSQRVAKPAAAQVCH